MTKPKEVTRGVRWLYYLLFIYIFNSYYDELQVLQSYFYDELQVVSGFVIDIENITAAFLYFLQFALYRSVSNGKNWARLIAVSINLLMLAFLALIFYSTNFNLIQTTNAIGTTLGWVGFIQTDNGFAALYLFGFVALHMLPTTRLLSSNAANWFKGVSDGTEVQDYSTQPKPPKKHKKITKNKKSNESDEKFKVLKHLNEKDDLSVIRYTADIGDAKSQYLLAVMYYTGNNVPLNFEEAVHWARKAAKQDFPAALLFMAGRYLDGEGVNKDEETGKDWLKVAAQSSDSEVSETAKELLEDIRISKLIDPEILKHIDPKFLK